VRLSYANTAALASNTHMKYPMNSTVQCNSLFLLFIYTDINASRLRDIVDIAMFRLGIAQK